jgi:hypothetical protein
MRPAAIAALGSCSVRSWMRALLAVQAGAGHARDGYGHHQVAAAAGDGVAVQVDRAERRLGLVRPLRVSLYSQCRQRAHTSVTCSES